MSSGRLPTPDERIVCAAIHNAAIRQREDGNSQEATAGFVREMIRQFGKVRDNGEQDVDWDRLNAASDFLYKMGGGSGQPQGSRSDDERDNEHDEEEEETKTEIGEEEETKTEIAEIGEDEEEEETKTEIGEEEETKTIPAKTDYLSPSKTPGKSGFWETAAAGGPSLKTYVLPEQVAAGVPSQSPSPLNIFGDAWPGDAAPEDLRRSYRLAERQAAPPIASQESLTSSQECEMPAHEVERRRFLSGKPPMATKRCSDSAPMVITMESSEDDEDFILPPKEKKLRIIDGNVRQFVDDVKAASTCRAKTRRYEEGKEAGEAKKEAQALGIPDPDVAPRKPEKYGKKPWVVPKTPAKGARKPPGPREPAVTRAKAAGRKYIQDAAEHSSTEEYEEPEEEPTVSDLEFEVSDSAPLTQSQSESSQSEATPVVPKKTRRVLLDTDSE